MALLVTDLLAEIRQAAGIASSSTYSPEGLTDADILRVANRELSTSLLPLMLGVREEFYVIKKSVAFTEETERIRIPARTIAGRVREIRATVGNVDMVMRRYEPTDKPWIQPMTATPGAITGYFLQGEWIVFLPRPSQSGTLDIYYLARPGRMTITANDYRAITAVDQTTGTIDFATWTYCDGTKTMDLVRGGSGFSPLQQDVSGVESGAFNDQFTIAPSSAAFAEVGDYVTQPDLTPVVPLPTELHGVLVSRVVTAIMRQLGKEADAMREEANARRLEDLAVEMLTPRVEAAKRPVRGNLVWRRGGAFTRGWW